MILYEQALLLIRRQRAYPREAIKKSLAKIQQEWIDLQPSTHAYYIQPFYNSIGEEPYDEKKFRNN